MNIFKLIIFIHISSVKMASLRNISSFWHISELFWTRANNNSCAGHIGPCVAKSLKALAEKSGQLHPDFILWSSAGGPYVKTVVREMKKIITNIIVLPSLPPVKLPASTKYILYYKNVSDYFGNWLDETARETFWKTGYYSQILEIPKNLQIIVLNTALFCKFHIASELEDPVQQWTWLSTELMKARRAKRKVYLLLSATPGVTNNFINTMFAPKHNQHYIRMVRTYSDVIKGQFGGYKQGDKFHIFYDKNERGCGWLILCPPSHKYARLYLYDTNTMEPLDYIQFYKEEQLWLIQYRFSSYYWLPNISVQSLELLVSRMLDNEEVFAKYILASGEYVDQNTTGICTNDACIKMHTCKIVAVDYSDYLECILPEHTRNLDRSKSNNRRHLLSPIFLLVEYVLARLFVNKLDF